MQLVELVEMRQEGVVFVEAFSEAEAWVEDDFVHGNAYACGGFEAFVEILENEWENFVCGEPWLAEPVLRMAAGVHQDGSAAKFGAGFGHGWIP